MSELNIDFAHTLDNIDQLSSLRGKLRNLSGPIANYPAIGGRFATLVQKLGGQTVEQLRDNIESSFDDSVNTAYVAIAASQRVRVAQAIDLITKDDSIAPAIEGSYEKYFKPRSVVENATPDLLYMLLLRPTNQTVYAQLDKYAVVVLQKLAQQLSLFTNRMSRVTESTTTEVLAEIKFDLEALTDAPPEGELRAWIDKTSVACGGRIHKKLVSLLKTSTVQASAVRAESWYSNWFELLSKLPDASRLFGKHETEVTAALKLVDSRLVELSHLKTQKTPAYLAQLVAEFGHQVSEAMDSVYALLSIRSLFIEKYNDVKENVTPN